MCMIICLFWVYYPNREFFTHVEKSPIPGKVWSALIAILVITVAYKSFARKQSM